MRFLKNFNIQWGWFIKRHKILGGFIFLISLLLASAGVVLFFLSFFAHPSKTIETSFILKFRIIAGILTLIFYFLYFTSISSYVNSSRNFKIAIDEAWKFAEKKGITKNGYLLWLIEDIKETKNPAELNEWIENFEKWEKATKGLEELEKLQEEIPQKIKEKQEERQFLGSELFHRPAKHLESS